MRIVAEIEAIEIDERANRGTRGDEEKNGGGDLTCDEKAERAATGARGRDALYPEAGRREIAGHVQAGQEPEEQAGGNGDCGAEGEHISIHGKNCFLRKETFQQRSTQQRDSCVGEHNAKDAAAEGDAEGFGEHLTHEAGA